MITHTPITRYDSKGSHQVQDPVVCETHANLIINGLPYLSVMCLPQHLEEWAVGFMFSEGLIKTFAEVKSVKATHDGDVFVATHQPIITNKTEKRVLVSGCAHGTVNMAFLNQANLPHLEEAHTLSYNEITEIMERFNKQSPIFNEAGGVHSAALHFKSGNGLFFEDIGRHNAVDKVIGAALMENLPLNQGALLTSGRISTEIALKAIRAGVPFVISRSGPTSMSLAVAQKANMTLVGFARGRRFNVYCGKFRITKSGKGGADNDTNSILNHGKAHFENALKPAIFKISFSMFRIGIGMINKEPITRFDSTGSKRKDDAVVRELRANLIINGELYLSMMCLPQHMEEMAVGFMFAEGLIKHFADIEKIEATCTGNIFVFTHKPINRPPAGDEDLGQLDGTQSLTYREIVDMMHSFNNQSPIFNEGGGVHFAALRFKNGDDVFYEDVGRHNAVDKVIGTALMRDLPIKEGVLLISGRISTEIVLKTARLGIPVLISQSGPTTVSLALAQKVNMTLVGFARGLRFNVYAGGFRVT